MSKVVPEISPELAEWITKQRIFFVATCPLSATGHPNCSPKGGDSFRVLGPRQVVYQDLTGSGAETLAHVRENGRIVLMFCAFEGAPQIVRLHGRGEAVTPGHQEFDPLTRLFPPSAGVRSFIRVEVDRISESCGFGVPLMDFREDRTVLNEWFDRKTPEALSEYRARKNALSIDGLPACPLS
jgi:hypothetical protein